ncbi:MAG: heme exporter protein CcmB [Xanthomonadales bacterium]|nr:heme exporter protein CcmB [Xanthomonadales bacterium]
MELSLSRAFYTALQRDLQLAWRRRGDLLHPFAFALLVGTLFAIGVGAEGPFLATAAAPVAFLAVLLALFLSVDGLFRPDRDDGQLDHVLISPVPLPLHLSARLLAYWLVHGIGLTLAAPLLALLLRLQGELLPILLLALGICTLGMSAIGLVGAALTVPLRRGGMLLALIVLPLYVPLLIFGCGAVIAGTGASAAPLLLAAALSVFLATLAPFAAAMALRLGMD